DGAGGGGGGRSEAEGGAAGKGNGVDAFDGLGRIEQSGLARTRPATAYVDGSSRGFVKNDRGCARAEPQIFGMADFYSRHVGNEIAQVALRSFRARCKATPKSIIVRDLVLCRHG